MLNPGVPIMSLVVWSALVPGEHLSGQRMLGAGVIILGLLVNVFGGVLGQRLAMRTQP